LRAVARPWCFRAGSRPDTIRWKEDTMWGQKWGQMIWGGSHAVPATALWGIVILCIALATLGVRFLRGQHRALGAAALLLALAIPLTSRAVTLPFTFVNNTVADATQVNANFAALASGRIYGFVNANGTLDATINGGIIDVNQPFTGQYCFKLGAPAKNAVATIDPSTTGVVDIIMTFVPHAGAVGLSGCPTGYNDAAAIIKNTGGALANAGFYVSFQ
jgi:hypothetical protein